MKKKTARVLFLPTSGNTTVLLIISISFLLGCLAGCILTNQLNEGGVEALYSYLDGFLSAVCMDQEICLEFWMTLWDTFRWPLLILILGITPLGLIGIPVIILIRSFLLSFSIASLFRSLGLTGLLLSIVLFFVTCIIYIPLLLLFGVQCFSLSGNSVGCFSGELKNRSSVYRLFIKRCAVFIVLFLAYTIVEYIFTPQLLILFVKIFQT